MFGYLWSALLFLDISQSIHSLLWMLRVSALKMHSMPRYTPYGCTTSLTLLFNEKFLLNRKTSPLLSPKGMLGNPINTASAAYAGQYSSIYSPLGRFSFHSDDSVQWSATPAFKSSTYSAEWSDEVRIWSVTFRPSLVGGWKKYHFPPWNLLQLKMSTAGSDLGLGGLFLSYNGICFFF